MMIALPFLVFLTIECLFMFLYHFAPIVVWIVVGIILLGGWYLLTTGMEMQSEAASVWYKSMGMVLGLAGVLGSVAGHHVYRQHIATAWFYDQHRAYTNVLPTDSAASHADAGVITFAKGSHVDVTQSTGYRMGPLYCAAPIMDSGSVNSAEFWAVGVDCCSEVGDMWCDDVKDANSRVGSVVPPDVVSWLNLGAAQDYDKFRAAVQQAASQFAIIAPADPIIVRWTSSAVPKQWGQAILWALLMAVGFLVLCFLFGMAVQFFTNRSATNAKAYR
eukprot:CAMPEP_0204256122 /NCGR_PEP_ID=MMETSP0468-20130131/3592_1 /ASSEMBLY_ACC=CAM_ASM_000383 /TAXON_ID=2969 /ORGANISM="Oxyrrhis marina" /LENGTH=274 /DNA_ID=CAMNT_0051230051 /DNA_START=147 /DNA_END=971 /DNA_ORIENTATION=-